MTALRFAPGAAGKTVAGALTGGDGAALCRLANPGCRMNGARRRCRVSPRGKQRAGGAAGRHLVEVAGR